MLHCFDSRVFGGVLGYHLGNVPLPSNGAKLRFRGISYWKCKKSWWWPLLGRVSCSSSVFNVCDMSIIFCSSHWKDTILLTTDWEIPIDAAIVGSICFVSGHISHLLKTYPPWNWTKRPQIAIFWEETPFANHHFCLNFQGAIHKNEPSILPKHPFLRTKNLGFCPATTNFFSPNKNPSLGWLYKSCLS